MKKELNKPAGLISNPILRKWRCPKGHEWETATGFQLHFTQGKTEVSTSPLCLVCVADYLNKQFPAEEVK